MCILMRGHHRCLCAAQCLCCPLELCALLGKLNITKDPKLEDARLQLEATMRHADIEVIKSSPDVRESIKAKVDTILGKFDW